MKLQSYGCVILTLGLIVILCGCTKEKNAEPPPATGSISTNESGGNATTITFSAPDIDPEYWKEIFHHQQQVMLAPDNIELRKNLCEAAYFENNRAIVVVGVGRRTNPNTGQQIPLGLVKQVAYSDAARWAAYISAWLEQDYQPGFGEISAALNTSSEVMGEMTEGDSLFVEVAYQY